MSTATSGGSDAVQGNIAPTGSYAAHGNTGGPKGKNVTEDPNLSGETKFGEIGTKDDPARQAELDFAKRDAASGAVSNRDIGQGGDSKFSGLKDESA